MSMTPEEMCRSCRHEDMKRTAWQHIKKIIGVAITPGRKVSDAEA